MTIRNYTRFIPGEEIDAVSQWRFGAVDAAGQRLEAQIKARQKVSEPGGEDTIRQEGYAEGFVQGQAQTLLEAQRQVSDFIDHQGQEAAQRFAKLFESAKMQLADAEQVMAQGVLELACELARQVLRQELSVNPDVLQPVIREALGILVTDSKSALVRLNPLDMDALGDALRDQFSDLSLTLLADAAVNRGGCLIESAGTVVDASLEKRWLRAVANLGLNVPWEGARNGP